MFGCLVLNLGRICVVPFALRPDLPEYEVECDLLLSLYSLELGEEMITVCCAQLSQSF